MSLIPVRCIPIEIRSLPSSLAASHRGFAFCLADPIGSAADTERLRVLATNVGVCDFKFGNERSTGSYFLEILGGNSPATAGKLPSKRLSQSSPGILFPRILGW